MEQKNPQRSRWKIPQVETFNYQFHFLNHFSQHTPEFINEMKNDLFPLYLDIFGRHEETTPLLSEHNWMLAVAVAEKNHLLFAMKVQSKLNFVYEASNQQGFPEETLKNKTDILLDKIIDIIKRHNLFFGGDDENTPLWLAHSVLCQVEAGTPYLIIPLTKIVYELPFQMLEDLWRELPELEQTLIMKNQESYFKEMGDFHFFKHYFESLDIFMKTYPFKTLPQPMMFDFRAYSIYEDVENYEKAAVKAFKEHIKNYTRRMSNALDENGFKRNKTDDYSQTEWLVIWNKHKVEYLWEIIPHIPEFSEVKLSDEIQIKSITDRLRKAFIKFKKFGLPIRPFGKKRKNSKQKIGVNVSGAKK